MDIFMDIFIGPLFGPLEISVRSFGPLFFFLIRSLVRSKALYFYRYFYG